jgi:hypothetical protein
VATEQVNEFFTFRRASKDGGDGGEVLAVWVSNRLDAGLPTWETVHGALESTTKDFPAPTPGIPEPGGLWIRESISLAGKWTLCWLDGPLLMRTQNLMETRAAILTFIVNSSTGLGSPGLFCPVFDRNESPESVAGEILRLKTRYPGVIGLVAFRRDERRAVYCKESGSQLESDREAVSFPLLQ